MRRLVTIVAALALAACSDDPGGPELSSADAVQVAMFEALFELEGWSESAAYCVSHGDWAARQGPAAAVLRALQRAGRPEVLADSECVVDMQGTFRADNGMRGQSFHIESIALEGSEALVNGFYRNHPLGAGGYECRIVRSGGRWEAEECTATWIA